MPDRKPNSAPWIAAVLLCACDRAVRADDSFPEPEAGGPELAPDAIDGSTVEITHGEIDFLVFNGAPESKARVATIRQLTTLIRSIEKLTPLSPIQRSKLELAGRGDIERGMREASELKRRFCGRALPKDEHRAAWHEVGRTVRRFNDGLHDLGSLFDKTVKTALRTSQLEEIHEKLSARLAAQHEREIAAIVDRFSWYVDLTSEERGGIHDLLAEQTFPPGHLGRFVLREDEKRFWSSYRRIPLESFLSLIHEAGREKLFRELRFLDRKSARLAQ